MREILHQLRIILTAALLVAGGLLVLTTAVVMTAVSVVIGLIEIWFTPK